MSVLFTTERGMFISHQLFSENIFKNVSVGSEVVSMRLNSEIFDIDTPFLRQNENIKVSQEKHHSRRKRKLDSDFLLKLDEMGTIVKGELRSIVQKGQKNGFLSVKKEPYLSCTSSEGDILAREKKDDINVVKGSMESDRNVKARSAAEDFYRSSWKKEVTHMHGQNSYDSVLMKEIPGDVSSKYLFPPRCEFHCCDVKDIEKHVKGTFDLVVLDPPWWNKYIRRKNAKCAEGGYQMMSNDDLGAVPVGNFLNPGALVAVWCTNSESNLETLEKKIFPQWGIEFIGRWFWIKVTKFGEPVCQFHPPPGKQPFEQIVFGRRRKDDDEEGDDIVAEWKSNKVVASVPSALHSHKPPLVEVLQPYIKPDARCLELFARYLLPGWTSVGFEVLKLQNCSLYEEVK
ncbi:N(6)-adenine-specific methyltransferase METTL4 [Ischnura elegans]|uniref:N(6)-adenine-specific methyltransferase METTL4 n=1 Tax=Ischnura elegans TaxID=197161 RepID=UPI001ED86EC8|nr:N(6)-adenine-specific methyltransferase METTL4 [Ischnura elegans]